MTKNIIGYWEFANPERPLRTLSKLSPVIAYSGLILPLAILLVAASYLGKWLNSIMPALHTLVELSR